MDSSLRTTSTTITIPGHIYRWIATHQHHVKWKCRRRARSSPFAKSVDCITDTCVLRDRKHRLAWLVRRYRSACGVETALFVWNSLLLPGHFLGRHPIRRVSGRLVQLPDGVFGKARMRKKSVDQYRRLFSKTGCRHRPMATPRGLDPEFQRSID